MEELRRELQRLTAIEATLPPEQQQLTRSLEQQKLLLTERERGAPCCSAPSPLRPSPRRASCVPCGC